jgi:hypothetical protein
MIENLRRHDRAPPANEKPILAGDFQRLEKRGGKVPTVGNRLGNFAREISTAEFPTC